MWDCRCRCRSRCRGRWWSVGCLLIGDVHNVPRVARSVVADELGALLAKEISVKDGVVISVLVSPRRSSGGSLNRRLSVMTAMMLSLWLAACSGDDAGEPAPRAL